MKYTQELHDRVRQNLRMFDYPRFDDGDIDALLDEIDRLNAYALRLLSDETRTWHCEKCGHNWLSNSLVGKTYAVCPECESPMRPMSEIRQEEIDRRDEIIARLKEAGNSLYFISSGDTYEQTQLAYETWRALTKELEC